MIKCILAEQGGRGSGGSAIFPTRFEVNTQPTRLVYQEGDIFSVDGLVATIYYGIPEDLGTAKIPRDIPYSNLSISPSGPLTASDTKIIVSYTENDVTVSTNILITLGYPSLVDRAIVDKSKTARVVPSNNAIGGAIIGTSTIQ